MPRFALLLAAIGCGTASHSDTDSGDTDGPSETPCDYPEMLGQWTTDKWIEDGTDYEVAIDLEFFAEVDVGEPVGKGRWFVDEETDQQDCRSEFLCVGRDEDDIRVVQERSLPDSTGDACLSGWAFFRLERDGRLLYEVSDSELGVVNGFAVLSRVD